MSTSAKDWIRLFYILLGASVLFVGWGFVLLIRDETNQALLKGGIGLLGVVSSVYSIRVLRRSANRPVLKTGHRRTWAPH